jgi:hypothetical protein
MSSSAYWVGIGVSSPNQTAMIQNAMVRANLDAAIATAAFLCSLGVTLLGTGGYSAATNSGGASM